MLSRIEVKKATQLSRLSLGEREQASREEERRALVSEIATARQQNVFILENHLAHDAEDRKSIITAMANVQAKDDATVQALRELSCSIRDARTEAAEGSKTLNDRLTQIQIDLAGKRLT